MNENDVMLGEGVSLLSLLQKLHALWKSIVGGVAIGVMCATFGILLIPPKYQAREVIKIGKVADSEVEAPEVVVERIKSPTFAVEAAKQLGDQKMLDLLLTKGDISVLGIRVNMIRGTLLIEVIADGMSSAVALKKLEVINQLFFTRYERESLPMRERLEKDVQLVQERIDATKVELTKLEKIIPLTQSVHDNQFAPISLLLIQNTQKRAELLDMQQQLASLQRLLLPPSTQPPSLVEPAFAGSVPLSPKKSLLFALGIISGLLGGIGWGVISESLAKKISEQKMRQHDSIV